MFRSIRLRRKLHDVSVAVQGQLHALLRYDRSLFPDLWGDAYFVFLTFYCIADAVEDHCQGHGKRDQLYLIRSVLDQFIYGSGGSRSYAWRLLKEGRKSTADRAARLDAAKVTSLLHGYSRPEFHKDRLYMKINVFEAMMGNDEEMRIIRMHERHEAMFIFAVLRRLNMGEALDGPYGTLVARLGTEYI